MWPFKKTRETAPVSMTPTAWAVRTRYDNWCKVVTPDSRPPMLDDSDDRMGPFRSEVDAEEFCDHANAAACGRVKYYAERGK